MLDFIAYGSSIVDSLYHVEDNFLEARDLIKGSMALIERSEAEAYEASLNPDLMTSGGSAANTVALLGLLGGKAEFVGKVADDDLGKVFSQELTATGAHYDIAPAKSDALTASCHVFITSDGERTMQTYLGACHLLSADDVIAEKASEAAVIYLEGYLLDLQEASNILAKINQARQNMNNQMVLNLSDPMLVRRSKSTIEALIKNNQLSMLMGNESEFVELFGLDGFDEDSLRAVPHTLDMVISRSEKGAVALIDNAYCSVPAFIAEPKDTTGAGDSFAAGFFMGQRKGLGLEESLKLGCFIASKVVGHIGARPSFDYLGLAREGGYKI